MARPRLLGLCETCGARVYSTTGYRAIVGWVPNRGTGTGGANQVRVLEGLHRFLCNGCYRMLPSLTPRRANVIDPGQMSIDDLLGPEKPPREVDVPIKDGLL